MTAGEYSHSLGVILILPVNEFHLCLLQRALIFLQHVSFQAPENKHKKFDGYIYYDTMHEGVGGTHARNLIESSTF